MKTLLSFLYCIILFSVNAHAQQLKTAGDSLAYSLGVMIGKSLQEEGYVNMPMDVFNAALESAYKNETLILQPEVCQDYVQEGSTKMKMKQFEANKTAGEEFLAKNKTRSGVITLADGIQYEILKTGEGPKPKATDEVTVHYHGTLIDGTIFDSSVDKGQPITYRLTGFIQGWVEILQMMPVGSKWKIYVPYQLAYGDRGSGPKIQPFSALIFEIELLGIKGN